VAVVVVACAPYNLLATSGVVAQQYLSVVL
jgi:hypothetical protein